MSLTARTVLEELEGLSYSRKCLAFENLKKDIFEDPSIREEFCIDLFTLAKSKGIEYSSVAETIEQLIVRVEDDMAFGDNRLASEVLGLAVNLEEDDYFGTEGHLL